MKTSSQDQVVERLEALYHYRVLDTEPEVAFDRIAALAGKVFDAPIALISLVDKDRLWFKSCYGLGVREVASRLSLCAHSIQSDSMLIVPDTLKDVRFALSPLVTGEPRIRFYAGAPLRTSEGHNLGTLCIIDTKPREPLSARSQGMLADLAAMVVDELELRRASSDLRASETRYRVVAETASDVLVTIDETNTILYLNPAAEKIFGHPLKEMLGQDLNMLMPEYLRHVHAAGLKRYRETGRKHISWDAVEVPGLHKDGFEIDLEISFGEYKQEGRHLFTAIIRDISERKRASEALERTAALLRATFNATAEGVLSVDEQGRVTDYNQRYIDMWRVPRELTELGDDGALVQHALKQVKDVDGFLDRVREASQNFEGETKDEIELRDGRIIERVSFPQRMGDRVAGRVWSFRDVTAWRSAEQSLKSLNSELEARVEARTAELERINAQLRYNAFHDPLTGLANRTLFLDRFELVIERSPRRTPHTFAVLLIDIDRLKVVNDSLGRAVGDKLLIGLGERLLSCVRPGDTVARVSQDEFAVLLEEVRGADEVERAVLRFKEEVQRPFLLSDQVIHISVSIGGVLGDNAAYDDAGYGGAEGVLRDAGIAMTRAKVLGVARYEMFTAELRERAANLQALESDLHGVTERHELRVLYQPIMFLPDGSLAGFEALVRWEHPKLGLVSPTEFVPVAEGAGLIIDVDRWVLREACKQLSRWQRQLPLASPLAVNVNLSSQQFLRTDLVDYVRGILEETRVQPEQLKLEITESVLMQRSVAVKVVFEQLKALGVGLYIDDFGTGYSSLSYLQSFPVDSLKIDRSFVNNMTVSPERAELVKTILAMAQTLKLDVVAEGIETEAQRTQLAALGCTYGQGYLFAKPLSSVEAGTFLQAVGRRDFARVAR